MPDHSEYIKQVYKKAHRRKGFDGIPVLIKPYQGWIEGYFTYLYRGEASVYVADNLYGGDYYTYHVSEMLLNPNPVDTFNIETMDNIHRFVKRRIVAKPKPLTRRQRRKLVLGEMTPEDYSMRIFTEYSEGHSAKFLAKHYVSPIKKIKELIKYQLNKSKNYPVRRSIEEKTKEMKSIMLDCLKQNQYG